MAPIMLVLPPCRLPAWATATWWIPMLVILGVWRHGYRRFPLFRPAGGPDSAGTVTLTHYYPPLFQGGFTFQGALGNWLWKGETAFIRYEQDL